MTSYVVGQAAIGFLSLFVGYVLGRTYVNGAAPKVAPLPRPVCMCTHNYGSHEEGRKCKADIFDHYNVNVRLGNCACRLYVGPDPLASGLWHPPVKEKEKE